MNRETGITVTHEDLRWVVTAITTPLGGLHLIKNRHQRPGRVHLDRIAGQLEQGKLSGKVSLFSDEEDVRVLSRLVNRGVLAFIGAALGVVSAMLLQIGSGPELTENVGLFDLLGFIGMFSGAILIMRVVLEVLRER